MSKIYIASSWKNADPVRQLAILLRKHGHEVFDFTDEENRIPELDNFVFGARQWAEYLGKNPEQIEYREFLKWDPAIRAFKSDKAGIDWADTIILLLPSGRSSHLEAGYAVGCGKTLYIYGDLPIGEFDAMYGFAKQCFGSGEIEQLVKTLHWRLLFYG